MNRCKQGRLASIKTDGFGPRVLGVFMQKLIQEALVTKREILIRKREVLRMTGLSNSTFYNPEGKLIVSVQRSHLE